MEKKPDFIEWLKTEAGIDCLKWPISEPKYLQNRLFWAFDAGRTHVWDQYLKEKSQNERLLSALKEREWISVSERPNIAKLLVAYKFGVAEAIYFDGRFLKPNSTTSAGIEFPEVTHWQPLPSPPKQLINEIEKQ